MKKTIAIMLAGAFALASTNCTTTYDAYGNPRQSVDPGTAAAGVAAAGVLGYALAKDKKNDNHQKNRCQFLLNFCTILSSGVFPILIV